MSITAVPRNRVPAGRPLLVKEDGNSPAQQIEDLEINSCCARKCEADRRCVREGIGMVLPEMHASRFRLAGRDAGGKVNPIDVYSRGQRDIVLELDKKQVSTGAASMRWTMASMVLLVRISGKLPSAASTVTSSVWSMPVYVSL